MWDQDRPSDWDTDDSDPPSSRSVEDDSETLELPYSRVGEGHSNKKEALEEEEPENPSEPYSSQEEEN